MNQIPTDIWPYITILGMAFVTVLTRVTGVWFMRNVQVRGRLAGALQAMPGAVLIAIVAPTAFSSGPAEAIAALITTLLAFRFPMLIAATVGVITVVALRLWLGAG